VVRIAADLLRYRLAVEAEDDAKAPQIGNRRRWRRFSKTSTSNRVPADRGQTQRPALTRESALPLCLLYGDSMGNSERQQLVQQALDEARKANLTAARALRLAEKAAINAGVDAGSAGDVISAQRIDIVEPDGTLRLVLSNAARLPGLVLRGREFTHPGRAQQPVAGLLFFNDEATETGGLVYAGEPIEDGFSSGVQLSFDNFEQDQVIVLASSDDGSQDRFAQLEFVDRPDWSIVDAFEQTEDETPASAPELPLDASGTRRMRLAREVDGSVGLTLCDAAGRSRLVLRVDAHGDAGLVFLDEHGAVAAAYPDN
jgi:hypothetical protein